MLVLGILPIARQGNANGMASLVSSKNQNSSSGIEVKFDRRKRNLVRVSGEYELSEFELSKKKKTESDWKVGSNPREVGLSWTVSGEFALSEFELPESNCIYKWLTLSLILISIILKMDFWSKCRPQKNAAKFYRKITAYQALLICKWFNF